MPYKSAYKKKRTYKPRKNFKKKITNGKKKKYNRPGRTVIPKYLMSNTMFVKLKA